MSRALSHARIAALASPPAVSVEREDAMAMALEIRDLRRVYRAAKKLHDEVMQDGMLARGSARVAELGATFDLAAETSLPVGSRANVADREDGDR